MQFSSTNFHKISDMGWWPTLSQTLDVQLRAQGIIPKHLFLVGNRVTKQHVKEQLQVLKKNTCRGKFSQVYCFLYGIS